MHVSSSAHGFGRGPARPLEHDLLCTAALVLSVLGLVPINGMPLLLSPVALVVSVVALARTRRRPVGNRGQAKAGLALSLVPLAVMGSMIAVFAAASTAA